MWERTEDEAERPSHVVLLQVDAGLRAAVPADELARAERLVIAPGRDVGPGMWTPETLGVPTGVFGALLIRGLATRETTIAGRRSADLLGPGDVLDPWRPLDTAIAGTTRWASDSRALIAILDERFLAAARRWPQLFTVIHERLADQLERSTVRAAIMGLPRVEQRVLGLFWQLAERWGTVRPEGVVIELALTHELIGQIIGAQRPTISLALQSLAQDGHLRRTPRGDWILSRESRDALPDVRPIGPVQTAAIHATTGNGLASAEPSATVMRIADAARADRAETGGAPS